MASEAVRRLQHVSPMTPTSADHSTGVNHATDESLGTHDVLRLSRAVARQYDARLNIVGVTGTNGESGRVELLVTVEGCHAEPCVLMLNVTRVGRAAFELELRQKLHDALSAHLTRS